MYFVFIIFLSSIFSQNNNIIKGKIVDSINNTPIPLVNISSNNPDVGSESDEDGFFSIHNINHNKIKITFSHIGYQSIEKEISLPQKELLIIKMK